MFARQQAADLMTIKDRLDKKGVSLAAIGSGSPNSARRFAKEFQFTGEMYVNRNLSAYQAFGLPRGVVKTLGISSLIRGVGTMKKGFRQGPSAGDLWQQGGLFVLGPGDEMRFAHQDRFAGDHADLGKMLESL
jgi:hypothetical protein